MSRRNEKYIYPDCEEHRDEMTLEVPSGFILTRDLTTNGLTFANCGFKCEGLFIISAEHTLVLNELILESGGIAVTIEGTLRINLHIPASFPTISLHVKNDGKLTITDISFDDPDNAKYNAIFSSNVNVDIPGIKKSRCYDTHNIPTFVTADSEYVCRCHFSDDTKDDVFKEANCDTTSAEYVLVLPELRTITMSRTWNQVVIENVVLTASHSSIVYTINLFDASFGGMVDLTFDVGTFVVKSTATIIRVRTLNVMAIDTDIVDDVLVVVKDFTARDKAVTESCRGGVDEMSRLVVGRLTSDASVQAGLGLMQTGLTSGTATTTPSRNGCRSLSTGRWSTHATVCSSRFATSKEARFLSVEALLSSLLRWIRPSHSTRL